MDHYHQNLDQVVDENGDLLAPWAKFPTYEYACIGWRMGAGEDWLGYWNAFLGTIPEHAQRLMYLERQPQAPYTWAADVHQILWPDVEIHTPSEAQLKKVTELELVAADVAYGNWRAVTGEIKMPWTYIRTPEGAARHHTREMHFFSRYVADMRGLIELPRASGAWHGVAGAFKQNFTPDPAKGLLTLCQMLCAGEVKAPWELDIQPSAFTDSWENDMHYADAFRLWWYAAFDDTITVRRYLEGRGAPGKWQPLLDIWCEELLP